MEDKKTYFTTDLSSSSTLSFTDEGIVLSRKGSDDLVFQSMQDLKGFIEASSSESPRMESIEFSFSMVSSYNPKFGDDIDCVCGHPYERHFDSYEGMEPVGCKYCACSSFIKKKELNDVENDVIKGLTIILDCSLASLSRSEICLSSYVGSINETSKFRTDILPVIISDINDVFGVSVREDDLSGHVIVNDLFELVVAKKGLVNNG